MPEEETYGEDPDQKPPQLPEEVGSTLRGMFDSLRYLIERFKPLRKHWYNSGVATIASATSAGSYEDLINFINDLGYPATAGFLQNRGPGSLFFAVSTQPAEQSGNEIRLDPGQTFRWGGPDNPHQIYYMHIRADTDDTEYQIIGGSGKLEITDNSLPSFYTIRSDKDSHFTGALAQNAKEDENLTGLASNKIMIKAVRIEADQALDFALIFWSKDTFDDTDLDSDTFIEWVRFQLDGTTGLNVIRPGGANQFYGSITGLNIPYRDDDLSNELHVSLMNLSAGSKNAGATGEVVVEVVFEVRSE